MKEAIEALQMVWATLQNLGWEPMPIVAAILAMLGARSYWEPSVLAVNTEKDLARMGWIKLAIFAATFFTSFMLQVGLAKPKFAFDWCLSIGFTMMDSIAGYVISSSAFLRNFLKNSLFKGGSNAQ